MTIPTHPIPPPTALLLLLPVSREWKVEWTALHCNVMVQRNAMASPIYLITPNCNSVGEVCSPSPKRREVAVGLGLDGPAR